MRISGKSSGASLFVTLSYPSDIGRDFVVHHQGGALKGFRAQVVFVTPKNGEHGAEGFLYDSDGELPPGIPFPITGIFGLIDAHFGDRQVQRARVRRPVSGARVMTERHEHERARRAPAYPPAAGQSTCLQQVRPASGAPGAAGPDESPVRPGNKAGRSSPRLKAA